jgi:hypothetical protein
MGFSEEGMPELLETGLPEAVQGPWWSEISSEQRGM